MPQISVLIAVYNTEKYLRECLDSLVNQSLKDIQIICIDDASTDSSGEILNEYASKDNRIDVIHFKENKGIAKARNAGLEIAKGKYTCFLDSDDWMAPDALKEIVDKFAEDPENDCVLMNCILVYPDREELYEMPAFTQLSGPEAFEYSLTWKIHGIYAIRTDIHKRYPYDESCKTFSDENITRIHYFISRKIVKCTGTYYYRQHNSSVTHNTDIGRFNYLMANISMKRQLENLNVSKEILNLYENVRWLNMIEVYMFYFLNRRQLTKEDRKKGIDIIQSTWKTIETSRLDRKYLHKFGYMPLKPHWILFRIQEELYFLLRKIFNRW